MFNYATHKYKYSLINYTNGPKIHYLINTLGGKWTLIVCYTINSKKCIDIDKCTHLLGVLGLTTIGASTVCRNNQNSWLSLGSSSLTQFYHLADSPPPNPDDVIFEWSLTAESRLNRPTILFQGEALFIQPKTQQ